MTNQRRRIFFGIMIAFPAFLFLFVEGGLRLIGYGPDLSLFTTEILNGREYHIMNPAVKHRYFSRVAFNPSTSPDYFLVPKPPGTFRIFCLGGSTTVGFPYWYNGAFSSFLRDRLHRVFPDSSIEVINLGMTATNSTTALDMAREIMDYEPDLVIVYDGHNEFYGALGVASHESVGGSRWLSQLSLRLIHLRVFLAMRDAYAILGQLFAGDGASSRGTMMEKLARGRYIPYGNDQYNDGLAVFRENLNEIRTLCTSQRVPVIFGTQVSNLRGLPPFISADASTLAPDVQLRFHEAFNAGMTRVMNGDFNSALTAFAAARDLLPLHAETHFRLAACLDTLGRNAEAFAGYRLARDYDELRFRTSSDFNNAIMAMDDGRISVAVDMERIFAAHSPGSIPGYGLILEHLHPSSYGQFLLATGYADAMRAHGFLAPPAEWQRADTLSAPTLWRERHLTEVDERLAGRRTEVLTTAWPFQQEEGAVSAIAPSDTLGIIADRAARGEIHWLQVHEAAIEHYRSRRDATSLEREYRTIVSQFPAVDVSPYLQLARVLFEGNRIPEMVDVFQRSLAVQPTLLAYRALGDVALQSNRPEEAARLYEAMFGFVLSPQEQVENGYLLAVAQHRSGHPDLALKRITDVLRLKPDYLPAVQLLATINGK